MCFYRKDELIGFPEIAVTSTIFVSWWNLFPKLATGRFTPISDDKCYDLASAATYDRPNPAFVPFFVDKWPHFVGFQHIFGFGGQECVFKFWVGFVLFLAKRPASGDLRQRCALHHACLIVHDKQTKSVPFASQCSHVSVPAHRVFHSLCTGIADCHSHCVHFWWYFGYCNFDICKQQVWLSCLHYTTNHFDLTTTKIKSSVASLTIYHWLKDLTIRAHSAIISKYDISSLDSHIN